MKNLLFSMFTVLCIAVGNAQGDGGLQLTKEGGAEISFTNETIDYGTIEQGADGQREFVFTNTGNEPLIITNCKGSCGCTVPQCPKEPILPGEEGRIQVKYDTNRLGQFTKSVTVTSNALTPSKVVKITGNVVKKEGTAE